MKSTRNYSKFQQTIDNIRKLGIESNNLTFRKFAVLHESDSDHLYETVINDPDHQIRAYAVDKITDQEILFEVAQNDNNIEVKKLAIKKISNRKYLLHLRLGAPSLLQPLIRDRYLQITQ